MWGMKKGWRMASLCAHGCCMALMGNLAIHISLVFYFSLVLAVELELGIMWLIERYVCNIDLMQYYKTFLEVQPAWWVLVCHAVPIYYRFPMDIWDPTTPELILSFLYMVDALGSAMSWAEMVARMYSLWDSAYFAEMWKSLYVDVSVYANKRKVD